jgi:hypothetical protein
MKRQFIIMICILPLTTAAQNPNVASLADNVLELLGQAALAKDAQYKFDNDERFNWAFVPKSRNGVSFKQLNEQQKQAILSLIKASLSNQGYTKATDVMALEGILRDIEGRSPNDDFRDPVKYFFTIFGQPSPKKPWGWRLEGHHLSLNFTSVNGVIESSTPSFMGANPAVVATGSAKGKEVLREETELAYEFINSLSADKLKIARFSDEALPEIVSLNSKRATRIDPPGISYKQLNDPEKKIFMELLEVYVQNYQLGFSKKLMDKITKAGLDNLSFAWAGGLKRGEGNYYRIQGPMLLIEYDNTQNNANHIHTVVRDFTNDFAEDILREHYKKNH